MPDRCYPNTCNTSSSAAGAQSSHLVPCALTLIDHILKFNVSESWDIYTGSAGKAVLLHRALRAVDPSDKRSSAYAAAALDLIRAAATAAADSRPDVSWLLGQPGVWSLLAVLSSSHSISVATPHPLAKETEQSLAAVRQMGRDIVAGKGRLGGSLPHELLYGRVGYLWSTLWLGRHMGASAVDQGITHAIIRQILDAGRQNAGAVAVPGLPCPLLYEWHGSLYTGAAHGMAGIVHVLLHYWQDAGALAAQDKVDVLATLDHLLSIRFDGTGNLPSSEHKEHDKLVQWCHGAPGLALTLAKAYEVTREGKYLVALREAAEVVWQRGLVRKLGLCHGIAGNMYPFLALKRVLLGTAVIAGHAQQAEAEEEAEVCLNKARSFIGFLLHGPDRQVPAAEERPLASGTAGRGQARQPWWFEQQITKGNMHGGDRPMSLYEGLEGVAYAMLDVSAPDEARFPGYEL